MLALECLSGWHIVSYPHVGTDNGSFSHGNASENGCIGIDNYIVVKYGVTGIILHWISIDIQREAFSFQGTPLVELDILPIIQVAPITTPVPWSMVKYSPISAPG